MGADAPFVPRILVVDDNADQLEIIVGILERNGYAPSSTTNAHQALQLVQAQPFDVILTDIVMPRLDGVELCAVARRRNPDIQAVIFTGNAAPDIADRARQMGAGAVLQKPFTSNDLLAAVREASEQARARAEALAAEAQECRLCGRALRPGAPRSRRADGFYHPGCYETALGGRSSRAPKDPRR
jgi:CheY-like chemotaxis protein